MSNFEVKMTEIEIIPHPNADKLELAKVGGYLSVVPKGEYSTGDMVVYIPEASVIPDWMLNEMGMMGRLSGTLRNQVKAIKLRGVVSQGLVYPTVDIRGFPHITTENGLVPVHDDEDVREALGIIKWDPPIPDELVGLVKNLVGQTIKYDIENIKKYPTVLQEGELVYVTEKLHGVWCCFGYHPDIEGVIISSKGLSAGGQAFEIVKENAHNVYLRAYHKISQEHGDLLERCSTVLQTLSYSGLPFYIIGELFGTGIQDLRYGTYVPQFRIFDIYVGNPKSGHYVNFDELLYIAGCLQIGTVPVLYTGPYSDEIVELFTSGMETVSGKQLNIREGIVIAPTVERRDIHLGRVKLKSVSDDYILRAGGTELA